MDESRRGFLKQLGSTALGAGMALPVLDRVLPAGSVDGAQEPSLQESAGRQWAMVVDVQKCLREEVRQTAAAACNREHNIPHIPDPEDEIKWIWTEEYGHVFPDQVHPRTPDSARHAPVMVLCNHCTNPPCTKVCPTGATWRRESDGIVMMDMHRCIGCRYCMAACPYGSRSFNWRNPLDYIERDENGDLPSTYPMRSMGVVEKCSFCAERIRTGRRPACVEAVNRLPEGEGALVFGDLGDPDSAVSRVLRERHTISRRASLGTGPNVYYIVPESLPALAGEGEA